MLILSFTEWSVPDSLMNPLGARMDRRGKCFDARTGNAKQQTRGPERKLKMKSNQGYIA